MVDDLGYHDLACYGHPKIKTPVIDQLAQDGVRLTSFYAGATVCTPSRLALLTGAYPTRLGWTKGVVGHIMPKGKGINPQSLTIAEVFKAAGYSTGMFGKWHLGDEKPFRPHQHGFDTTYYINKSNNQTKQLWIGDRVMTNPFDNRLLTQQFTENAIQFVRTNKNKPFFLYLPYTAPHFPVQAHPDWKGKSDFGVYGDVVEELDHRIGELLAALQEEQLKQNTIVVFLSDNGPEPLTKESKADPYRGKKWSALEGGTRVPCIARYPEAIPRGQTNNALIAAIDLLPTLAHACGIDLKKHRTGSPVIDGVNVWASLCGERERPHPRTDLLYWHGADGFQAIRMGNWKLHFSRRAAGLKGGEGPALFDLSNDIQEKNDLSADHPDLVARLKKLSETRLAEIEKNKLALGSAK